MRIRDEYDNFSVDKFAVLMLEPSSHQRHWRFSGEISSGPLAYNVTYFNNKVPGSTLTFIDNIFLLHVRISISTRGSRKEENLTINFGTLRVHDGEIVDLTEKERPGFDLGIYRVAQNIIIP